MPLSPELVERIKNNNQPSLSICASLRDGDIAELVQLINQKPNITNLTLDGNLLNDEGAIELTKLKFISYLSLATNDIGNIGAIALVNSTLFTVLNFARNNSIDSEAGRVFLQQDHIIGLDLTSTHISGELKEKIQQKISENLASFSSKPKSNKKTYTEEKGEHGMFAKSVKDQETNFSSNTPSKNEENTFRNK